MGILDQFRALINPKKKPVDAQALAGLVGVRMQERSVAPNMTPDKLAHALRAADQGYLEEFITLAGEMEERDLHYYSLLQTRKLAVAGAPLKIEAAPAKPAPKKAGEPDTNAAKPKKPETSDRGQEIADAVRELVSTPIFYQLQLDLLDALAKGFAVVQPIWDTTTTPWSFKEFKFTDQRFFQFDLETHRVRRLRDAGDANGQPLPPGQFVAYFPHLRSAPPGRCGLARLAVTVWMFKNFTVNDWVAFAEVYGMPLRLGKYDPATITKEEKSSLRRALVNIGHDSAAMISKDMDIEFVDGGRANGISPFAGMAEYFDKQMSKGILGQTMTSDDGASLAQAKVHEGVQVKIAEADSLGLCAALMDGVIRPWVLFNFGEDALPFLPTIEKEVSPPEDLKLFTEAALPWVAAGLKVSAKQIRDKLDLDEPEDEDDTLGGPPPAPVDPVTGKPIVPPAPGKPGAKPPAKPGKVATNHVNGCLCTGCVSLNQAEPGVPDDAPGSVKEAERLALEGIANWEPVLVEYRDTIEALGARASSYDEFLENLSKLPSEVDSNKFVRQLAIAAAKARLNAASEN